jgi:hypothetical protein
MGGQNMKHVNELNNHQLIDWVLNHVEGYGLMSTVHYTGEDVEEWATPKSLLHFVAKELKEVIEP